MLKYEFIKKCLIISYLWYNFKKTILEVKNMGGYTGFTPIGGGSGSGGGISQNDIVDNTNSTATDKALSANQGRVLRVDEIEARSLKKDLSTEILVSPSNMTSYNVPAPYVVSASREEAGVGYEAWRAFYEGTTGYHGWFTAFDTQGTDWLMIDMGQLATVSRGYTPLFNVGNSIQSATIYGSNDGTTFEALGSQGQHGDAVSQSGWIDIICTNVKPFRYFKLVFSWWAWGQATGYWMPEFQLTYFPQQPIYLDYGNKRLTNTDIPVLPKDLTNKKYVDECIAFGIGGIKPVTLVDNLTTQDPNKGLSANQGYVLNTTRVIALHWQGSIDNNKWVRVGSFSGNDLTVGGAFKITVTPKNNDNIGSFSVVLEYTRQSTTYATCKILTPDALISNDLYFGYSASEIWVKQNYIGSPSLEFYEFSIQYNKNAGESTYPIAFIIDGVTSQQNLPIGVTQLDDTNYEKIRIRNTTGSALLKSQLVTVLVPDKAGTTVELAQNTKVCNKIYIVENNIPINGFGFGVKILDVSGINTTAYTKNDKLYLGVDGGFVNVRPTGASVKSHISVGTVLEVGGQGRIRLDLVTSNEETQNYFYDKATNTTYYVGSLDLNSNRINHVSDAILDTDVPNKGQMDKAIAFGTLYKDIWFPATGLDGASNPIPPAGQNNKGWHYSTAEVGTWNGITFAVGDILISNGTVWQRIPHATLLPTTNIYNMTALPTINTVANETQANINNKIDTEFAKKLNKTDTVNDLTSTSTEKPLSANMGKLLNDTKPVMLGINFKADNTKYIKLCNFNGTEGGAFLITLTLKTANGSGAFSISLLFFRQYNGICTLNIMDKDILSRGNNGLDVYYSYSEIWVKPVLNGLQISEHRAVIYNLSDLPASNFKVAVTTDIPQTTAIPVTTSTTIPAGTQHLETANYEKTKIVNATSFLAKGTIVQINNILTDGSVTVEKASNNNSNGVGNLLIVEKDIVNGGSGTGVHRLLVTNIDASAFAPNEYCYLGTGGGIVKGRPASNPVIVGIAVVPQFSGTVLFDLNIGNVLTQYVFDDKLTNTTFWYRNFDMQTHRVHNLPEAVSPDEPVRFSQLSGIPRAKVHSFNTKADYDAFVAPSDEFKVLKSPPVIP